MNDSSIWQPELTLLNQARMGQLHKAATTILETTGLNVHHPEMRRRLADAGAKLGSAPRVHLSPVMVERALASAKRHVIIHDRLGEPVMPLGAHQVYFGTGSDLVYTRDIDTGERRPSVLEDVARAARLCDALDEIDFVMSYSLPSDLPDPIAEIVDATSNRSTASVARGREIPLGGLTISGTRVTSPYTVDPCSNSPCSANASP